MLGKTIEETPGKLNGRNVRDQAQTWKRGSRLVRQKRKQDMYMIRRLKGCSKRYQNTWFRYQENVRHVKGAQHLVQGEIGDVESDVA